jgi:hypothetical protein
MVVGTMLAYTIAEQKKRRRNKKKQISLHLGLVACYSDRMHLLALSARAFLTSHATSITLQSALEENMVPFSRRFCHSHYHSSIQS